MHLVNRLYQEQYDFSFRTEDPSVQYMLATIPRSGSTYFALELWKTGVLGAPMEYANTPYISMLKERLHSDLDIVSYWREVQKRRTSPNGVFGYKMFIKNYLDYDGPNLELSTKLAPDKVVFLTRKDITSQAVSLSRAVQSKAWFHGVDLAQTPRYCFDDIQKLVEQIEHETATWERIFEITSADVLRVAYEDLIEDRESVIKRVCQFVGSELDDSSALDIPCIKIQRTPESAEWVKKYEVDRAEISASLEKPTGKI